MAIAITTEELQFIEDVGMFIENSGGQRTIGRILGYLLLAEEPKSLDEIAADLLVSKATASLTVRQGLLMGLYEKTSIPGDRKIYFRINVSSWMDTYSKLIHDRVAEWERILDKAVGFIVPEQQVALANLTSMRNYYDFFEWHLSNLDERYKQWKEGKVPAHGHSVDALKPGH